jgi:hypothetical protein
MKDTLSGFRKHETLDRLPQNDTIAMDSTLQKVVTRHDRTIAEKFYQGQAKKTPRVELQRNFDTLPTTLLANHQTNPEALPKSFRRNRFEIDRQEPEEVEEEGRIQHEEPEEENKSEVEKEASREEKRVVPRLVPF